MTRAPVLPSVYRLVALDVVGSTNDEAKRLAALGEAEAPDGTLVWAKSQTSGRGRRGRTWESPAGNLYCSLVLRPGLPPARAAQLGFVASLAVYDALASVCGPGQQAACKWPNDVLLNGRKVAGLLLETESAAAGAAPWVVLGVGVNVARGPESAAFPATSLHAEGETGVDAVDVLEAFARHFLRWTGRWLDDGFPPIRKAWLGRAAGKGQAIEVRLDGETLSGVFEDVDEEGALILGLGGGRRRVAAGDVFFA
jgi:BirA family biotin operon repressor/biotin-[acetyl-CoA-carboxylase] ligase